MRPRRLCVLRGRAEWVGVAGTVSTPAGPLKNALTACPTARPLGNDAQPAGPEGHTPPSRPPQQTPAQSAEERTRAPCLHGVGPHQPLVSSLSLGNQTETGL